MQWNWWTLITVSRMMNTQINWHGKKTHNQGKKETFLIGSLTKWIRVCIRLCSVCVQAVGQIKGRKFLFGAGSDPFPCSVFVRMWTAPSNFHGVTYSKSTRLSWTSLPALVHNRLRATNHPLFWVTTLLSFTLARLLSLGQKEKTLLPLALMG